MFCVKCGKELQEETLFCPTCGTSVQGNTTGAQQVAKQESSESVAMKKYFIIGVAVVILLLLAIVSSAGTGTSPKKTVEPVVGTWTDYDGAHFYFHEDHSGSMEVDGIALAYTWQYNASTRVVTLNFKAVDTVGKLTYYPSSNTLVSDDGEIVLNKSS